MTNEFERRKEEQLAKAAAAKKALGRMIGGGVLALICAITLMGSWYYVEGGEFVREQSPTGSHEWVTTQGLKFKIPWASRIERFNQFSTISLEAGEDDTASVDSKPHLISFADTYSGHIQANFRYSIAPNPTTLEALYQATKTQENLNHNTLLTHARNLLTYTGNQVYGEDFMQGGQNDFLTRLYYQGEHGLYVTERVKEKSQVESGFSELGEFDDNAGHAKSSEGFVWKVKRVPLDEGGFKTQKNVLKQFGITLELINITKFDPEERLTAFINKKKDFIAKRAEIVEKQRNEREAAVTSKLEGERKRIEARNTQLIQKDAAVIAEQKRVDVEKQKAELAKVQKQKELDIATANEGIQKANFAAAKYEAQAQLELGLANAKVLEAEYDAKNNPIYLRELEVRQAEGLYKALPQIDVQMPYIVNGGSAEGGTSAEKALGQMSNLALMNGLGIDLPKGTAQASK